MIRLVPETERKTETGELGVDNEYGVHDTFRLGIKNVRADLVQQHPLENILAKQGELDEMRKMTVFKNTQGFHAALRMQIEKQEFSRLKRLPVLGVHDFQRDILMGRDTDIDFEDFLNTPAESTKMLDVHGVTEVALGMSRGAGL